MLHDLSHLDLEAIEQLLYSQVHHSTYAEEDVSVLAPKPEMPRRSVSYRPVRYFLRKKNTNPKQVPGAKTVNLEKNLKETNDETLISEEVVHPYPINNILVFPQNSDTLINVISKDKDFSFKKLFRKFTNRKRKEKQRLKKMQNREIDIKPNIRKIKVGYTKTTPKVNKHTIILSDSEDEVGPTKETSDGNNSSNDSDPINNCPKNREKKKELKMKQVINLTDDDDVIVIETPTEGEIIEIDDSTEHSSNSKTDSAKSVSKYKPNERSELLSTPESSASNDFLENVQPHPNSKFNFGLHGFEFKDSQFLRPMVPVDISESGSISSLSDVSGSIKANVFNEVDFPREKENLFDENNLEKFKNSITPHKCTITKGGKDEINISDVQNMAKEKHLPTLSDIQGTDNQERMVRGRSIIRELVNDRAYVLLSSTQKKIKNKKRKSRDGSNEALIDDNGLSRNSSLDFKKKKRKKTRKNDGSKAEDGDYSYVQFTEDSEMNKLRSSSPLETDIINSQKKEKRKEYTAEQNIEESEARRKKVELAVRKDLFPGSESDCSDLSKKNRRKKKSEHQADEDAIEEYDEKRKLKKSKHSQTLDNACKKMKKKEKSAIDYKDPGTENNSLNEYSSFEKPAKIKKKKRNVEIDEQIDMDDEENISFINVEEADRNQVGKKRKKKSSISEKNNVNMVVDTVCTNEDVLSLKPNSKKKRSSENRIINEVSETNVEINEDVRNVEQTFGSISDILEVNENVNICNSEKTKSIGNISENDYPLDSYLITNEEKKVFNDKADAQNSCQNYDICTETTQVSPVEVSINSRKKLECGSSGENNDKNNQEIERTFLNGQYPNSVLSEKSIGNNDNKDGRVEINSQSFEKGHSVWSMCSTKFFSSSESLFTVSNIRTEAEASDASENNGKSQHDFKVEIDTSVSSIPECRNSLEIVSQNSAIVELPMEFETVSNISENISKNVHSIKQESSNFSDFPDTETSKYKHDEVISNNEMNFSISTEVKIENENNESSQDNEEKNTSGSTKSNEIFTSLKIQKNLNSENIPLAQQGTVNPLSDSIGEKMSTSKVKQNLDSDSKMKSNGSFKALSNKPENIPNTDKEEGKLPDVIEEIVREKQNASGMRKLCEFLEKVEDPNDVLKKVSMIKQAFLAQSIHTQMDCIDTSNEVNNLDDNDILSISSDDSSIICLENNPVIDIENDILLANCEITNSSEMKELNMSSQEKSSENNITLVRNLENEESSEQADKLPDRKCSEKQKTCHRNQIQVTMNESVQSIVKSIQHGEMQNYKRGLDEYEVEAIQMSMSDDPKLWKISSDDLPQRRPPLKGRRCIKCREIGHLANSCTNKPGLPKCFICGVEGHLDFKCPNRRCTQCGRKSPIMQSSCKHCQHYRNLTCSLCKYKGHPRHKCPDLWRRYHLTVEHGPLIRPVGMKLKGKNDLWCSFCAKSGHLEHYCYLAQRNRNFQPLDPIIHNYIDVYNVETKTAAISKLEEPVVSDSTLDKLEDNVGNPPTEMVDTTQCEQNNLVNLVPLQSNSAHDLSQGEEIAPSSLSSLPPNNSVLTAVNDGLENLPPDFVVIDEIFSTPPVPSSKKSREKCDVISNNRMTANTDVVVSESENVVPAEINESSGPQESKEMNTKVSVSISDAIPTSTKLSKMSKRNKDFDKEDTEDLRAGSSNVSSEATLDITPKKAIEHHIQISLNNNSNSDSDIQEFFMSSNIAQLQEFVRKELSLLGSTSFKIKHFFFRFLAYEEDNNRPVHERHIPQSKRQTFFKQLNMLLFGKELFRGGPVHLRKLEVFVNTLSGSFSESIRQTLYLSYDYIFKDGKHDHVNYFYFLKLLMEKEENFQKKKRRSLNFRQP